MNKKEIEINLIDEFIEVLSKNKNNDICNENVIEWLYRQRYIIDNEE